jgi:hypothetical protein
VARIIEECECFLASEISKLPKSMLPANLPVHNSATGALQHEVDVDGVKRAYPGSLLITAVRANGPII